MSVGTRSTPVGLALSLPELVNALSLGTRLRRVLLPGGDYFPELVDALSLGASLRRVSLPGAVWRSGSSELT